MAWPFHGQPCDTPLGAATVRAALDPQYFADEVKLGRDSFQEAGRLGSQVSREHLMVRATGRARSILGT